MTRNNNNYQVKTLGSSRFNYSREAEVIHGNAATGEQYSVKRVVYSEVQITPEIARRHWDEMDKEVEKLQAQYPYQVISAVSYENEGGNQVIKFTPTTELIFPDRVPIFDEDGKEIIGEENIRAEVKKREAQWAEWERDGKLQESVEIHHTDDGKTVRIKFRAAPKKVHPREINTLSSLVDKFGNRVGEWWNGESESNNPKKPKCVENSSETYADNRENPRRTYNHQTNSQELKDSSQKLESSLSTSSTNERDKKSSVGSVITVIGLLGTLFSICIAMFIKRRFSIKNKKR